jgi:hypothetical protein
MTLLSTLTTWRHLHVTRETAKNFGFGEPALLWVVVGCVHRFNIGTQSIKTLTLTVIEYKTTDRRIHTPNTMI